MCDSFSPYFYLHLLVINELGVLIPCTPFEGNFLETVNVTLSQITPNMWNILRDFDIV